MPKNWLHGTQNTSSFKWKKQGSNTNAEMMDEKVLTVDIMRRNQRLARKMIEEGADVMKIGRSPNLTPLRCALQSKAFSLVPLLLERGADAAHANLFGITALHTVCSSQCSLRGDAAYDMCKLLIDKGAGPNVSRQEISTKMTPLLQACRFQSLKVIRLFLDHGADISAISYNGKTALHYAAANQDLDVFKFVLDQKIDVDCNDKEGNTALHIAAERDKFEACELLLKRGAAVRSANRQGRTPLRCWFSNYRFNQSDKPKTIELLLEHGADVGDESIFNDVMETRFFYDRWSVPEVKMVVIRHMVKLKYVNSTDVEYCALQEIEGNEYYKYHYEACLKEFEGMKEAKFYNDLTVFNVLTENDKIISGYAKNEELVEALEKNDYEKQFHYCFAWLKKRFDVQVRNHWLRTTAAKILSNLFGFNDSSHLVTQNILRHLSDDDLEVLCSNSGSASV